MGLEARTNGQDPHPAVPVPVPSPRSPVPPNRSRVLILAPTRELAVQIEDEIHGLAYHTSITSAAVYGGVEMGGRNKLRAGVDIIVATPGRLMDHMRQQNADLGAIDLLVLDEADRMMDMGFWPDVKRIITVLPPERETLLFSATMPDEVVRLALEIMREPKFVQVGQRSKPATSISHEAVIVPSNRKLLVDRAPSPPAGSGAGVHADENRRGSVVAQVGIGRREVHGVARRPFAGSTASSRRIPGRAVSGPGGNGHCRPRSRHRWHSHGDQLRDARFARGLRASRRPHRACG